MTSQGLRASAYRPNVGTMAAEIRPPLSGDENSTESSPQAAADAPAPGERIAKRLARVGLCSRRDAERWIAEGRVVVNGKVLDSPALVVRSGDDIIVDGKPVPEPAPTRLWRYYKPSGLVTTARDEKGRATVFEKLPADLPRVVSIGRLDLTTEGLLLLTNDGELARFLELPSTGWARRYRVRVHGIVDPQRLAGLARGITVEGIEYGPIEAVLDRQQGANAWLTITLREGKNREVRKVLDTLGLEVNRLIRIAYGPFQLGKLEEGLVEEVPQRVLKDQLENFFAQRDTETGATTAPAGKWAPSKSTPHKGAPHKSTPHKSTPGKSAPSKSTPGKWASGKASPGRSAAPAKEASGKSAPGKWVHGKESPGRSAPAKEASGKGPNRQAPRHQADSRPTPSKRPRNGP